VNSHTKPVIIITPLHLFLPRCPGQKWPGLFFYLYPPRIYKKNQCFYKKTLDKYFTYADIETGERRISNMALEVIKTFVVRKDGKRGAAMTLPRSWMTENNILQGDTIQAMISTTKSPVKLESGDLIIRKLKR
jgi:hypothetical protein